VEKLDINPGDRYGRLVIVQESGKQNGYRRFLCKCDCGTEKNIDLRQLRSGDTKSCGCYKNDIFLKRNTKHGLSGGRNKITHLYNVWLAMRQRCLNKNNPNYKNYGQRGIRICEEWDDYEIFHNWAMSNGFAENFTIERIDNNSGYNPSNCTWIPQSKQSCNTRRNKRITFNGKTRILKEWATELEIKYDTLFGRLARGWDVKEAFTTPLQSQFSRRRA
jgi:hypothetical protein